MRDDMDRVIVERARYDSEGRRARWARPRRFDDDAPARETNAERARRRSKGLSDYLAPLRRFLEGNIGRPWDRVWSELCVHLRMGGTLQRHVRGHVEGDLVITQAVLVDGVPCYPPHERRGERRISPRQLYVCPRTGRLLRPRRARAPLLRARCTSVERRDGESYELVDGAWYRVTWGRLGAAPALDVLTGRGLVVGTHGARAGDRFAASKRQVGGRELRELRAAASGRATPRLRSPPMTDPAPAPARSKRPVLLLCAGAPLLLGLGVLGANAFASRNLAGRATRVKGEVEAERAQRRADRPPLLHPGEQPLTGDAADDYASIEWILVSSPLRTTAPAAAGLTGLGADHPKSSGVDFELGPADKVARALEAGEPPTEAMTRVLSLYGPLARHVRDGVRRPQCDWGVDLTQGVSTPVPPLKAHRAVAQYMAFEAQRQAPLEAARTGLVVVAYGRDIARHGSLVGLMVGAQVERVGLHAIARAADRGLTPAGLEEVLAALGAFGPRDLGPALTAERLALQVEVLRIAGHPVPGSPPLPPDAIAEGTGAWPLLGPVYFERELAAHERAMDGMRAVMGRPAPERAKAQAELVQGLGSSTLTGILMPDLTGFQDQVDRIEVERHLARVLVAAHLHRHATGGPPADLQALAERLGGQVPQDPFAPGAPVRFAADPKDPRLVRAWSLGPDLVDGGGVAGTRATDGDVVMTTRLPAP